MLEAVVVITQFFNQECNSSILKIIQKTNTEILEGSLCFRTEAFETPRCWSNHLGKYTVTQF